MSHHEDVIVYGASGYTGKLVAESLHRRGLPFIAAGRDAARLERSLAIAAERAGASCIDARVAVVEHDVGALAGLFAGAQVVVNVTGPFAQIGETVVEAALRAGCHYLDTTGEQDFMLDVKQNWGKRFAEIDRLLAPACAYMWTAGAIAAELCLETPGIDSLELVYLAERGVPSVASTRSFMRMLAKPHYFLRDDALVAWPLARLFDVALSDASLVYQGSPWGGAGEPVWYQDDPRVRNCRVLQCADNDLMRMVAAGVERILEQSADKSDSEREVIANAVADTVTLEEPAKEDPEVHRALVTCRARGTLAAASCSLVMHSPYVQTGELIAEACRRLLARHHKAVGFSSPVHAFGHRELLDALARAGLVAPPRT